MSDAVGLGPVDKPTRSARLGLYETRVAIGVMS
jgi:hypothetical protein